MNRTLRPLQPAIAAFAFTAMLLHAAFWVICAQQLPPGGKLSHGERVLLAAICSPAGARPGPNPFEAPGETPAIPADCPACALVCGPGLSASPAAVERPAPPVVLIRHDVRPAQIVAPAPVLVSLRPRAPPADAVLRSI